jgi:hypothetical protein
MRILTKFLKYGQRALNSYLSKYGRESGRKDLLTKVVSLKTETGAPPLTDKETYTEIGNLVAAGTGTLSLTRRKYAYKFLI